MLCAHIPNVPLLCVHLPNVPLLCVHLPNVPVHLPNVSLLCVHLPNVPLLCVHLPDVRTYISFLSCCLRCRGYREKHLCKTLSKMKTLLTAPSEDNGPQKLKGCCCCCCCCCCCLCSVCTDLFVFDSMPHEPHTYIHTC